MPKQKLLATSLFLAACLALPASATAAPGGPVILGGDDLTQHGNVDGGGNAQLGWLYIQRAIGNIKAQVTRTSDNSIAALGSTASNATSDDAGAAIGVAAAKNSMTVQYFDGAGAIDSALAAIASGSYRPAIVWIAGDDAPNDLHSAGPCTDANPTTTEGEALTGRAGTIAAFVNSGGGLMSHGKCYPWLQALLPGLDTPIVSNSNDLYLTPEGVAAFPGLTNADINAGPWHNIFQGNLGGLGVLVRSNVIDDSGGADAPVIIGGARVSLTDGPADLAIAKTASPGRLRVGEPLIYTLTVRNNGPNSATGVVVTDALPAGLTSSFAGASKGTCTAGTTIRCSIGTLGVGETATVRIAVRPGTAGTLRNRASVTGNPPDLTGGNDTAVVTTVVDPAPVETAPPARADHNPPRLRVTGVRAGGSCYSGRLRARVRVSESHLRRVSVYLDSRRIKRTGRKRFGISLSVRRLSPGRHRLTVIGTDHSGNRRTLHKRFVRCSREGSAPRFTG